jgi:putative spermidine/putrescine transport system substrate-binding protein
MICGFLPSAPANARDLTVVGFGGVSQNFAKKHFFQAFAKQSGVPVSDDVYNGEMAKIYSMVKSKDVTWDVVMVEQPELAKGCEDGVFEQIDWSIVHREKFIPGGTTDCGAGALGWGVTLFYDQDRIKDGPKTYAEFWDTKRFPGKRTLRSGAKMTLEVALLADGVPKSEVYKTLATAAGQDRAFAMLDKIKSTIVWWKAGPQPLQLVGSGEVAYAVGYVGRAIRANEEDKKNYSVLWDTMLYSIDMWAVVRNSPMKKQAMEIIDFMTDEAPLLAYAKDWPVSPATASVANNEELKKKNPGMVATYANRGLIINTEFWLVHGDQLEARFSAWQAK